MTYKKKFRRKMTGQIWSLDFMSSVTVFFFILIVLFFTWDYATYQSTDQMIFNEMENRALTTADMIIRSRGFPEDWNESNVQVLGLAEEENILNQTKILTFVGMDYDVTRQIFGIPSFHYHFRITNLNGSIASLQGTDLVHGVDPAGYQNSTVVIPIERSVLFDSKVARLRFILWR